MKTLLVKYDPHTLFDGSLRDYWSVVDQYGNMYSSWHRTPKSAEKELPRLQWEANQPVGIRVSGWLSEARTVLSRAQTAFAALDRAVKADETPDPEHLEIRRALEKAILYLTPFARTGKMPKYKPETEG